ncbi:MAG: hypothetical protein C0501_08800 [Isosphaera sp.]|nr:hypothetical protein [Isosphaera sp.]
MRRTILAAAVLAWSAAPARAQFVCGPACPPGYGGFGYTAGFGFAFGGGKPKVKFGGFAGGFYSSRSVVVESFGFAGPVVVARPVVVVVNPGPYRDPDAVPPRPPAPDPIPAGPFGGQFLVIEPRKPLPPPGVIVPDVDRVAPRLPLPPPPGRDLFADPVPAKVDRPDPDPVKEAARLLRLGREAFAAGDYGRAAEQFGRAAGLDPKAAGPLFLKGQAAFASGGYGDAVAAVRAGLELDPAWPAGVFDPKEPYGANAAAFAVHLADLRKAVAANPGEPALEFLLGYQLWFVGEQAEAKKWFAAAAKRLPAPGPIALFK